MELIDYIYCLFEVDSDAIFYVGRTIHPQQRLKEHQYGARIYKEGDEDKYCYAHALDAIGIKWDLRVVQECGEGTEFFEDYYVNLFRMHGEPIQNMKAGDDQPWMGRSYASPEDFVAKRTKCVERMNQKVERVKKEKRNDQERTLFTGEKVEDRFMSPWMKQMMQAKAPQKPRR